jgi:hypothetical protein
LVTSFYVSCIGYWLLALQPLVKENGKIDSVWFSFFEKSYKTTGASFGIPSSQEKLSSKWHTFFENMFQETTS